jgi:hypothetical protein
MVRFTPRPFYPRGPPIVDWVGLIAGLDYVERRKFFTLPGLELRPFDLPVRSRRYIDCTIPAPKGVAINKEKLNRKLDIVHFSMLCLMQFLQVRFFFATDEDNNF